MVLRNSNESKDQIYANFGLMKDVIFKRIYKTLSNWSSADVRTVPNVMYQIRCGTDESDDTIEYQINWFIDCAETYIHNHRNSFVTFCLEGEYEEKIWDIINENDGTVSYKFTRDSDNKLSAATAIPGTLRQVNSRFHFPGNKLLVDTEYFHSVTQIIGSNERVLTFLVKKKYSIPVDTYVLNDKPYIDTLDTDIRSATDDERYEVCQKLIQILENNLFLARS